MLSNDDIYYIINNDRLLSPFAFARAVVHYYIPVAVPVNRVRVVGIRYVIMLMTCYGCCYFLGTKMEYIF